MASMPVTTSFADGIMINDHCLDALKKIKDKSVSAIIIDPPYGAQTHNQNIWDIAWSSDLWKDIVKECFRILVGGGHMVVFASGKTIFDIHMNITSSYQTIFRESPSFYRMIWKHNSLDSGRVHSHTPRSQFEDLIVYFRTGEGRNMFNQGTLKKTYGLDQHIGRANVLEFYKDDCRNKPQPTVKKFFKDNPNNWTFDYKPEGLMRALIRDFTSPGHTVVDFCMRHGMTAVAAKLELRNFIAVELEKNAYERAVSRYSELFSVADASPVSSPRTEVNYSVNNRASGVRLVQPQEEVAKNKDHTHDTSLTSTDGMPDGHTLDVALKAKDLPTYGTKAMKWARLQSGETGKKKPGRKSKAVKEPEQPRVTTPMTGKTKRNSDSVLEEVPSKRQAISYEGNILDIGTPKRCTRLLVFKKIVSIDWNQYLVAYPDKINQLKTMTIEKKDVQGYIGKISAADMKSLDQAFMPSRF